MNEQDYTALVQKMYAAFGRGDFQTIIDNLSPDVEWSMDGPATIPFAGMRVGHAGVRQFFEALVNTQDEHKLTIDQYIAQGESVATVGRYAATVKTTGKKMDAAVVHIFNFKNGKLVSFRDFTDTAHLADAYVATSAAGR